MIGANGAGTDKLYRRALEHGGVNPRHRTHQQRIGVQQMLTADTAPGQRRQPALIGKEGLQQGNIFVGNDMHERGT